MQQLLSRNRFSWLSPLSLSVGGGWVIRGQNASSSVSPKSIINFKESPLTDLLLPCGFNVSLTSVTACNNDTLYSYEGKAGCCCFEIIADNNQQTVCGFDATIMDNNGNHVTDDCLACEQFPTGWRKTIDSDSIMHWSYSGQSSGTIGVNQPQVFKFCQHTANPAANPWSYHICPHFCVNLPGGGVGPDPTQDVACCQDGSFDFQCIFTNGVKGSQEPAVALVSVFPNPSSVGYVKFSYDATSSGSLQVSILSSDGKEIEKAKTNYLPGTNNFSVDTHGLASGSYLCTLTFNGQVVKEKFVVTH